MYFINRENLNKKKIRGQKSKFRALENRMKELSSNFPEPDSQRGYWHVHFPTSQLFIDSYKTPVKIRKQCIQLIINCVQHLINLKPEADLPMRVVAAISLPNLWDSQVIVFFGNKYFSSFFDRNDENQKWIRLADERNIEREWHISVPNSMKIRGYQEEILDEDTCYTGEIWFVGELE